MILFLLLILLLFVTNREYFTVKLSLNDELIPSGYNPYNVLNVNENPIPSLYDRDTEKLRGEFVKINKDSDLPLDYETRYKLQLFFYSSPLNKYFKEKILLSFLTSLVQVALGFDQNCSG